MSTELSLGLEGGSDDTCSAEGRLTAADGFIAHLPSTSSCHSCATGVTIDRMPPVADATVICIDTDREFDGLSPSSVPQL